MSRYNMDVYRVARVCTMSQVSKASAVVFQRLARSAIH